jgi:hypothetical protein
MIPQQAVSTVTNVDDIESYIGKLENSINKRFLRVIDLSRSERAHVLGELSVMGITAGSMMPGLDGTCEDLKNRMFGFG